MRVFVILTGRGLLPLVHFIVMFGIVLFILVQVGLTLIVPRTLLAMVVGRATELRHIVTSEDAR